LWGNCMKLWIALRNAFAGWNKIVRDQEGWRGDFKLTNAGLSTALAIFLLAAFLAVAVTSMSIGMPGLFGVVAALFVLALPITALVVTLLGTRIALGSTQPANDVLVPGTYALTAFLVAEGFLAAIGGPVVMLAWLGLGYLLFRLARVAAGWHAGIAA